MTSLTSPLTTDGPPEPSQQRKAMEAAVAAERTRVTACEAEEAHLTADELRAVLKRERKRTAKLAADLAAARCTAVQQQVESEVFEEGRINGLMRTVDHLQHELEREEEMVSKVFANRHFVGSVEGGCQELVLVCFVWTPLFGVVSVSFGRHKSAASLCF